MCNSIMKNEGHFKIFFLDFVLGRRKSHQALTKFPEQFDSKSSEDEEKKEEERAEVSDLRKCFAHCVQ